MRRLPEKQQATGRDHCEVSEEALLRGLKAEEVRTLPWLVSRAAKVARLVLVIRVQQPTLAQLLVGQFHIVELEECPHRDILSSPDCSVNQPSRGRANVPANPKAEPQR